MAQDYTGLEEAGPSQSTFYNLGNGRVVKTGYRTSMEEAYAMVFVRAHTKIPVPEVFMVFEHAGLVHIVMELVQGSALREAVPYDADGLPTDGDGVVTDAQLQSIMRELQGFIEELRALGRHFPSVLPAYGSFSYGPYHNTWFCQAPPAKPFATTAEFHAYWLRHVQRCAGIRVDPSVIATLKKYAKGSSVSQSRGSTPQLTHGDLAPRNILIRDGRIVAIVDWDTFGWYPEFWEDMGIRNEVMSMRVRDAIESVFGKTSEIARAYVLLFAALRNCPP